MAAISPPKIHRNQITVFEEPPELGAQPSEFKIELTNLVEQDTVQSRKSRLKVMDGPYLIVGFDTEFKTPEYHVSRDDIDTGQAKFRVLSYQFHAKTSDGIEWQGINCTQGEERLTLAEFLVFVLGKGIQEFRTALIPTTIFLVGHFTRADIPAFADFKELQDYMSAVRNTFLSIDKHLMISIEDSTGNIIQLRVVLRDTMLLTPQASKSLKGIGKLVGFEKLQLHPDPKTHKNWITRMDWVRLHHWESYKAYALMDASICLRYIEKIIEQYENVTGKKKVPVTLTSIGVDLLLKHWREDLQHDPLELIGKEKPQGGYFDKNKGYYVKFKDPVPIEELSHHLQFITESYHGGRNEQYWFGPAIEDNWIDIDLSSAYPTAMSIIGTPDWRAIRDTKKLEDFTATTLGFAWVDFEFPKNVRYPCLPVRTSHGLIFPMKGTCYCAAPELVAAQELGAKIKIRKGVVIPTDPAQRIFMGFIRDCIKKRNDAGSKTLEGLFWKEISNSTYGKTAQGLMKKRVYDMREKATKQLPASEITNPCYASFITSFVRALLGEIMNNIPYKYQVFSCTTDGFLTNLPEDQIPNVISGQLANIFLKSRKELTGSDQIVEIKHKIKQPLGWRTRGQATLKTHSDSIPEEQRVVLAKGGIFTPPEAEDNEEQNQSILDLFFDRQTDSVIRVESLLGIRDIVEHDADAVTKVVSKRLSMEFDWKRQPTHVGTSNEYNHVYFDTQPWMNVDQFDKVRELWDERLKNNPICLKTENDFNNLADFIECNSHPNQAGKYMKRNKPDIARLKQLLCSAWQESKAGLKKGLPKTANEFAELLTSYGIPTKRSDVENGAKRSFVDHMHTCPPTDQVKEILGNLKSVFPKLRIDTFLYKNTKRESVTLRPRIG